jgi:hypothetical protein
MFKSFYILINYNPGGPVVSFSRLVQKGTLPANPAEKRPPGPYGYNLKNDFEDAFKQ